MRVRFDGDCPIKRAGESPGHFPVSGVDENVSVSQAINEFLQESFGVPLLIRVIEKDLEPRL